MELQAYPLRCVEVRSIGDVTLGLTGKFSAAERGTLLRQAERQLKDRVDAAIVVYLEPVADRNALRKLRGVSVNV